MMFCALSKTNLITTRLHRLRQQYVNFFREDEILQAKESLKHDTGGLTVDVKAFGKNRIGDKKSQSEC